ALLPGAVRGPHRERALREVSARPSAPAGPRTGRGGRDPRRAPADGAPRRGPPPPRPDAVRGGGGGAGFALDGGVSPGRAHGRDAALPAGVRGMPGLRPRRPLRRRPSPPVVARALGSFLRLRRADPPPAGRAVRPRGFALPGHATGARGNSARPRDGRCRVPRAPRALRGRLPRSEPAAGGGRPHHGLSGLPRHGGGSARPAPRRGRRSGEHGALGRRLDPPPERVAARLALLARLLPRPL